MIYSNLKKVVIENISYIAERIEKQPEYPWIDTKFNIVTGETYHESDVIRGKNTVYSWVQGRGLESLVVHISWLETLNKAETDKLATRLKNIVRKLYDKLFEVWQANKGHFFFLYDF